MIYDAINAADLISTDSFKAIDPYEKNNTYCAGASLDNIDINSVPSYTPSLYNISAGGPMYSIMISKLDNNNYAGFIWSYAAYTLQNHPWTFMYINGTRYLRKLL